MWIIFKEQKFSLRVLLSICLNFYQFKLGVAYKSVAYRKSVYFNNSYRKWLVAMDNMKFFRICVWIWIWVSNMCLNNNSWAERLQSSYIFTFCFSRDSVKEKVMKFGMVLVAKIKNRNWNFGLKYKIVILRTGFWFEALHKNEVFH